MDCPCDMCNRRHFFEGFTYENGHYEFHDTHESEAHKSVWERLSSVSDELDKLGVQAQYINELNDLCDEIQCITTTIEILKKQYQNDKELTRELNKLIDRLLYGGAM